MSSDFPALCAAPSQADTTTPYLESLLAVCGMSYIFSSKTYPVHQKNSSWVLMDLWAIIGELMGNACRAWMLYPPGQFLSCGWWWEKQHQEVGSRSWSQTRLHVVPERNERKKCHFIRGSKGRRGMNTSDGGRMSTATVMPKPTPSPRLSGS